MTKIINYENPDVSENEITYLAVNIISGSATITVENTADFEVDDYVIIESVGNEQAEMLQIQSITSSDTIVFTTNVIFNHSIQAPIRKTYFNQARLYRSTDNITYTLIETKEIDWQDKYNKTNFVDNSGSDDYYYKVEYYNSTNLNSEISDPIKTITQAGFISINEFKQLTGIKASNEILSIDIRYGAETIARKLYTPRCYETGGTGTQFELPVGTLEFADTNYDLQITKDDFIAYEKDQDNVRTYITSDISSIDINRHLVTFNSSYPSANKSLVIEYLLTYRKLSEIEQSLKMLNALYAANNFFRNIPLRRMQRGIGGWNINGVSMDFQGGEIRQIIDDNNKEIIRLIMSIERLYTRKTRIGSLPSTFTIGNSIIR